MANLKSGDVKSELDAVVTELVMKATRDLEVAIRKTIGEHQEKVEALGALEKRTAGDLIASAQIAGVKDFAVQLTRVVDKLGEPVRVRVDIPNIASFDLFPVEYATPEQAPRFIPENPKYRAIFLLLKVE